MSDEVLFRDEMTTVPLRHRWPAWAPPAAAVTSAALGIGVGAGALAGQDHLAGLPGVALPGAAVLLFGAVMALASIRPWGRRLPSRLVSGSLWTAAVLCVAGSCWLLLDLCQLALEGTVTDRDGHTAWLSFSERLGLTLVGALLIATALAARRTAVCPRCGQAHGALVATRPPEPPRQASRRIRWVGYAGCLAWLPYAGVHSLGALGVPGMEPTDDHQPPLSAAIALWVAIGLSIFLLLGLVSPWGQIFPWWAPPLSGRRVPRFLPITPVWLIAPTFVLYGLGAGVFALMLLFGLTTWHGQHDNLGLIGFAQPISFTGYGVALIIAAISYQVRTRPVPVEEVPCPAPAA